MLLQCAMLECASTGRRAERASLIVTSNGRPEGKHRFEVWASCESGCGCEDGGGWIGVEEFCRSWRE